MSAVVIVGAGPAGIAAAGAFVEHGLRPVVIDETPQAGGQIYRRPEPHLNFDPATMLGSGFGDYERFHQTAEQVLSRVDYRPQTSVWAAHENELYFNGPSGQTRLSWDVLIAATGAIDRVFPVMGWTLPGVYTLGAAQVLLKGQGHMIGQRVVFCGSSPLLALAARQYVAAGGTVAAVLDTTTFAEKLKSVPDLLAAPSILKQGLGHMLSLKRSGVRLEHGVRLEAFRGNKNGEGDAGVSCVAYRDQAGKLQDIECDAVALGFGLRPETQLPALAGCHFKFDTTFRQWLPEMDADGRAGNRLFLAGDGATIGGAAAAKTSGRLAALAALKELGHSASANEMDRLRSETRRLRQFQRGLARAFAWPAHLARDLSDETIVCRCENVTAGMLRQTVRTEFGATEINRIKAKTRCGMGRCQGRFCELAAAEIVAEELGCPLEEIGRLRGQPPVKPVPIATPGPTETSS